MSGDIGFPSTTLTFMSHRMRWDRVSLLIFPVLTEGILTSVLGYQQSSKLSFAGLPVLPSSTERGGPLCTSGLKIKFMRVK